MKNFVLIISLFLNASLWCVSSASAQFWYTNQSLLSSSSSNTSNNKNLQRGRNQGRRRGGQNSQRRQQLFLKFDTNGDGQLNESEREAAKAARKARLLERFDTNGDGVLSEDEKPQKKQGQRASRSRGQGGQMGPHAPGQENDDHHQRMLEEFDEDGDGKLSEAEREAAHEAMEARMLEKFDTNGDGVLSEDERPEPPQQRGQGMTFGQNSPALMGRSRDNGERKQRLLSRFDEDGDGRLNETERKAAKTAREALRNDPRLQESRQSVREAHQNLIQAMQSGNTKAIAAAQKALKSAREGHKTIRQEYADQY